MDVLIQINDIIDHDRLNAGIEIIIDHLNSLKEHEFIFEEYNDIIFDFFKSCVK